MTVVMSRGFETSLKIVFSARRDLEEELEIPPAFA